MTSQCDCSFTSIFGDTTRLNALRSVAVVVVSGRKTYRFEPPSVEKSVLTESDRLISPAGTYRGREEESPCGLHPKNTGGIHGGRRSDESEQDLEGGKWDEDEEEEREMRSTQPAFQGRGRPVSGSGVLGKCPSLSGCSLDRPRSYPDSSQLPITQRRLFALSYLLYFTTPLSLLSVCVLPLKLHISKMGAIPEVDPDEPVETKPFKFVTGKSTNPPPMKTGVNRRTLESMANMMAAGAYAFDFLAPWTFFGILSDPFARSDGIV